MTTATFEYAACRLKDLQVPDAESAEPTAPGRADKLLLRGRPVRTGNRFWHSLQVRFAFTANIFKYFTHAEVFRRISPKVRDGG